MFTFVVIGLAVWFAGAVLTVIVMTADPGREIETHEIVWWPLTWLKFLWRTLWRAVATGWRP